MGTALGLLVSYLICLVLFVGLDMVWLLGPGRPLYVSEMGELLRASPQLSAAMAFYLLYCAGIVLFVVWPASRSDYSSMALFLGLAFGLVAYGTYDLTGLAVVKGFTTKIALIDMAWGSILTGVVAWASLRLSQVLI